MNILRTDNKIAITYANSKISYGELNKNILNFADTITINKGEVIGIYSENRPEWVYSLFAIWHKGAVAVPIDYDSSREQVERIIKETNMKNIFVSQNSKKKLDELGLSIEKSIIYNDILLKERNLEPLNIPQGEQEALILFTSGTSGISKGVVLCGRSLFCNAIDYKELGMVSEDDVISTFLPLHHAFPLNATCLTPLYLGATMAMSRGVTGDDIREVLEKNKLTMLVAVPRVFIALHSGIMSKIRANKLALSLFKIAKKVKSVRVRRIIFTSLHKKFGGRIRVCISGGAKLDEDMWNDFETLAFPMVEGYGLSETSPALTGNTISMRKIGTVGRALGHVELKVEEGELLAKGPIVMKGYYNNPEETRKAIDSNGWFHTGDLAEIDSSGYVTIKGRKNSLILLSNGKNINPEPLEKLFVAKSKYVEDIVILPHKDLLKAVVTLKENWKNTSNIETFIKEEFTNFNKEVKSYEIIRDFKILNEPLPKTPIGKIKRYLVKFPENIKKKEHKKIEIPKEASFKILYKFLQNLKGIKEIAITDDLDRDLAMDSLDIMEFKSYIESYFNTDISTDFFIENNNLLKIHDAIKDHYLNGKKRIIRKDRLDFKEQSGKIHNIGAFLTKPLLKFLFNFDKKLSLSSEAQIIISNHQSFLDSILINSVLTKAIREKTYYIAKRKHFKNKLMKSLVSKSNIILIDDENINEVIDLSKIILNRGNNLVIFPEGTRSKDGNILEFKRTFANIAIEIGAKVTMLAIKGAYEAWPYNKKLPRRYKNINIEVIKEDIVKDTDIYEYTSKVEGLYINWLKKQD